MFEAPDPISDLKLTQDVGSNFLTQTHTLLQDVYFFCHLNSFIFGKSNELVPTLSQSTERACLSTVKEIRSVVISSHFTSYASGINNLPLLSQNMLSPPPKGLAWVSVDDQKKDTFPSVINKIFTAFLVLALLFCKQLK